MSVTDTQNRRVGKKHKSRGLYMVYAQMSMGWKLNRVHPTYISRTPAYVPWTIPRTPRTSQLTCTWDVRGIVRGMYVGYMRDCTKLIRVHPRTSADMSAGFLLLAYPPINNKLRKKTIFFNSVKAMILRKELYFKITNNKKIWEVTLRPPPLRP